MFHHRLVGIGYSSRDSYELKLCAMTEKRGIRSFVLRQGRLTKGQEKALDELMPRYGFDIAGGIFDPETIFGNSHQVCLEIGFGMGESLAMQAASNSDWNYIGLEVHRPGIGHLLMKLKELELDNVRVIANDAVEVLEKSIPARSLDVVQIFFPDPWPKKRHHKRRLINENLLDLLTPRLKPEGLVHMATDWAPYAEEIKALFANVSTYSPVDPPERPMTKFERRGRSMEHTITDFAFVRRG